jgi:hypothetical protein
MENKSIVQWCKDLHEAGNELKLVWEGGGDSGWAHFQIDDDDVDNKYTRALVDRIYDTLNYGSWAGEFTASGEAIYNPETNAFEGTDFYGEDDHEVIESNIIIKVPKSFWFDILHVECEANYDDDPQMSVRFIVKNGFLTDQHTDFCSNLENTLGIEFSSIFNNFESANGYEFRGCTDSWILDRAEAIEEGDMLVFTISKLDLEVMTSEERNVVLELNEETATAIDETLNNAQDEED